ncbi:hypothetical protein GGS24DRAFT_512070 [Hypoxylon argillaceum]|nr:hypothetical protein GGS24DRAFT_512070 [Hypoxylon argillaceum]
MDPLSALGAAAAVLQFVDASIKAYKVLRGANSNTERNKELEDNIRAAQTLENSLTLASTSQGVTDPVTEITARCASKSRELLTLLEHVRGPGKGRIQTAARAFLNKNKIESLHTSLVENRAGLNLLISQRLLSSVDLNTAAHTKEFQNLDSSIQKLIHDLAEQQNFAKVGFASLSRKVDRAHKDVQLRFTQVDQSTMREKILESLFFPDMHTRRYQIKEPTPGTLDWLFSSTHENLDHGVTWSDFNQWLRKDTSTYWISGKAGSGKSTLMAHLVRDRRTRQELNAWSSGHKLEVLSFFFWRAGSDF